MLTVPVHVVEESQTSAVDHAICDVVRRQVPHAQHMLIEGAGHMMPLTHPEPLTRALLTGIGRLAGSSETRSLPSRQDPTLRSGCGDPAPAP